MWTKLKQVQVCAHCCYYKEARDIFARERERETMESTRINQSTQTWSLQERYDFSHFVDRPVSFA